MIFTNIKNGRFYNEDCFDAMREIPDGVIDMILCDLPYETVNWKSPHDWDKSLPMRALWDEYFRVVKPNGAIALFGNEPFSTLVKSSNLLNYKYDWIWRKSKKGGFANAKVKPLKSYETVMIFSEGTTSPGRLNNMPYYPQDLIPLNKKVKNSGKSRLGMTVRENAVSEYIQEFTNYPSDVLDFDSVHDGFHPTQKPVALFEYLIKTYTNEGELVLDNTAGSGTTAIAAINTNRKWVCIEKKKEYYDKAINRIINHNV